jgi:hypothetical protein
VNYYFILYKATIHSMANVDAIKWHGLKGKSSWPAPKLVAASDKANRADQKNMIKANEYMDSPEVLNEKMDVR